MRLKKDQVANCVTEIKFKKTVVYVYIFVLPTFDSVL